MKKQYQADLLRSIMADLREDLDECEEALRNSTEMNSDIEMLLTCLDERGKGIAQIMQQAAA